MNVKRYTLKEAQNILGVTYKTILYYREQYPNEVIQEGRFYYVTENFLNKVKHNRDNNARLISDTKEELLKTQSILRKEISELKAKLLNYEEDDSVVVIPNDQEGILDLMSELYGRLQDLGSTDKIEIFTEKKYAQFEAELREHKSLLREIKQQEVYFEEVKASKDEVIAHYKNQFEYQRQIADKQLEQMDKLITYLRERGQREGERAHIEAVEKKIIPREYNGNDDDPYRSRFR